MRLLAAFMPGGICMHEGCDQIRFNKCAIYPCAACRWSNASTTAALMLMQGASTSKYL
jgi:hypothetical protein